ncbi:MAG: hypothetical protein A2836_02525 [Candidatus Taylorbacteria bacterium RIFCSPHIGHO2_01_FULL_45_63]|uniref:Methyltransferase type 11 domain-containing protein n=1 Tax=Candidatus Taylorbacteria bacterium RIFCSPHIGHO2_02_FULL_45_35 TaxID=1802311 RepID=A0A1G2MUH3_9BACT|nr:MAG: hypothetical protein A2836_02525 [Candidatus Taylorbacteria bacterium RIFCSPHIGHO2_01_FULL_45_63]OHA26591.1 MAG: hypothetical protein A3D56_03120 [Candidatus Taylorbacteria bacterium RIFCSPHIGHO2_02_FULL_45_35]OHA33285.1 MAG: hypothetical protein A3A22_01745 [Candidatus Taylorbacteria bacterium RIFCSPLOWO2_01_FULL_45_34b]
METTDTTKKQPLVRHWRWSPWKKSNYDFLKKNLAVLPSSLSLLDVGAGIEPFYTITWRFNHKSMDWQNFGTTDIVTNITESWPVKNNSFNIIVCTNTLEHVNKPQFVLGECKRVLAKQGTLVGTVPFLVKIHQEPHDYYRYTHYALKELLTEAGFADVEIVPLSNSYNILEMLLKNIKKNNPSLGTKMLLKAMGAILYLFGGPLKSAKPTLEHCEGFGFVGKVT